MLNIFGLAIYLEVHILDEGSFYIFNKLIKNTNFKEKFLNRYLYIIEDVFNKFRVESLMGRN